MGTVKLKFSGLPVGQLLMVSSSENLTKLSKLFTGLSKLAFFILVYIKSNVRLKLHTYLTAMKSLLR